MWKAPWTADVISLRYWFLVIRVLLFPLHEGQDEQHSRIEAPFLGCITPTPNNTKQQ